MFSRAMQKRIGCQMTADWLSKNEMRVQLQPGNGKSTDSEKRQAYLDTHARNVEPRDSTPVPNSLVRVDVGAHHQLILSKHVARLLW